MQRPVSKHHPCRFEVAKSNGRSRGEEESQPSRFIYSEYTSNQEFNRNAEQRNAEKGTVWVYGIQRRWEFSRQIRGKDWNSKEDEGKHLVPLQA